jgi:hypothetical protein
MPSNITPSLQPVQQSKFEDGTILDEPPTADYSKGGVVFVGSSNMKWAVKLRDLPPVEGGLLHNYGLGAANHADESNLLRFLAAKEGLSRSGPGKTQVILGVSYHTVAHEDTPDPFVLNLWRRHGLYDYGAETVDSARPVSAARRFGSPSGSGWPGSPRGASIPSTSV